MTPEAQEMLAGAVMTFSSFAGIALLVWVTSKI